MKKYQQLLLVILSLLSFISLLFYRHEYNKLRYVLEVFNFFGTPGAGAPTLNVSQNESVERYIMSEPLPAWQRISNTLYVYSAFWETVEAKGRVKAPAIGILNENLNYGCYLWYEAHTEPVKGQFSFSVLQRKNAEVFMKGKILPKYQTSKTLKTKGFMFYCDTDAENTVPVGVTFYKRSENETSKAFLPVYKMKVDAPAQNSTAICVLPNEYSYLNKRNYLEFLSFHKAIGIKDFVIYGAGYQYNMISTILKNATFDISLMVLQWNYPFQGDSDLMLAVAENDCLLRTNGLFENLMMLKWNQFFVPHSRSSMQNIMVKMDPARAVSTFQIYPLIFCLEYDDDPEVQGFLPLIIRKTQFSQLKIDSPIFLYRTNLRNGQSKKVSKDLVSIHWYEKCDMLILKLPDKIRRKVDRSMHMYQSDIMQSKLMRLQ